MKYLQFNSSGNLVARFDEDPQYLPHPEGTLLVSEEIFWRTINETDGIWKLNTESGEVYKDPLPGPTQEELEALERQWRDEELVRADKELNKVQDSDSKAIGTVGDWRAYRKNLRSLPEHELFPTIEARPVAPDAPEDVPVEDIPEEEIIPEGGE